MSDCEQIDFEIQHGVSSLRHEKYSSSPTAAFAISWIPLNLKPLLVPSWNLSVILSERPKPIFWILLSHFLGKPNESYGTLTMLRQFNIKGFRHFGPADFYMTGIINLEWAMELVCYKICIFPMKAGQKGRFGLSR
ncbi:hypothetical protein MPH_02084 [Macrophomina phaseolina MS6]|uniref:Uncharacterized protein n=1 Tax=Macrophomina phaseolina (strain MS6) TaxID=1126212 RepID=K2S6P4_MACPH|nr:hypothetical protein MPH_02084 [Macrophomina phaseolina MS6]